MLQAPTTDWAWAVDEVPITMSIATNKGRCLCSIFMVLRDPVCGDAHGVKGWEKEVEQKGFRL